MKTGSQGEKGAVRPWSGANDAQQAAAAGDVRVELVERLQDLVSHKEQLSLEGASENGPGFYTITPLARCHTIKQKLVRLSKPRAGESRIICARPRACQRPLFAALSILQRTEQKREARAGHRNMQDAKPHLSQGSIPSVKCQGPLPMAHVDV